MFSLLQIALVAISVARTAAQPDLSLSFDSSLRAQDALRVLTQEEIENIAKGNGMTVEELGHVLATSQDLLVTASGALAYVCNGLFNPDQQQTASVNDSAVIGSVPVLHSRPGAPKVIYIDFDGHVVANTRWQSEGEANGPFTIPSTTCTGTSCDREEFLTQIWMRVREYYWHMNIDVTTEEPSAATLNGNGVRVAVGGDGSWSPSFAQSGGVAFLNSFAWTYQAPNQPTPAFCFPDNLGNRVKAIADCIAHEAGHTLGLQHDGHDGDEYYEGQGIWAPIMGASYYKPIAQWSKGEYNGATNRQDDLEQMKRYADTIVDNSPNTPEAARVLTGQPSPQNANILIGTWDRLDIISSDDVDCYRIDVGIGAWQFVAQPYMPTENLAPSGNILLTRYQANTFEEVAAQNPNGAAANQGASLQGTTTAPTRLYFCVRGAGEGDPRTTGFSSYGSIGAYTIAVQYAKPAPGSFSPQLPISPRLTSPAVRPKSPLPIPASPSPLGPLPDYPTRARQILCGPTNITTTIGAEICRARNADTAPCESDVTANKASWFIIDNPTARRINITTCDTQWDTTLFVFKSPAGYQQPNGWDPVIDQNGQCVGFNDDTAIDNYDYEQFDKCFSFSSTLSFQAAASTRYYVLVGGYLPSSCNGPVSVTCWSPTAVAAPSPRKLSPSPSPKRTSPSPARSPTKSSPKPASPSPKPRSPSPKPSSPSPKPRSPSPKPSSPVPRPRSPSPNRPRSPSPKPSSPSPKARSPSPLPPSPRCVCPSPQPTTVRCPSPALTTPKPPPSPRPANCSAVFEPTDQIEAVLSNIKCDLQRLKLVNYTAIGAQDPQRLDALATQVEQMAQVANQLYGVVAAAFGNR